MMRTILPLEKNPALRDVSHEIPLAQIPGARVQKLIADMRTLLAKEKFGVALAAVQVGEPLRLFIVSGRAIARDKRNAPDEGGQVLQEEEAAVPVPDQIYINPVVTKVSRGKKLKHEGCLSLRGKWGEVPRAEKVTLRAYDEQGKKLTRGSSGFLAHVFQHEMDHLEGILYTDKAAKLYDEQPDEQ